MTNEQRRFEITDEIYLNGKPIKLISGGFHYFRTVPEYWRDRLLKLKAMGCNTVETYMPWNLHEPRPGEFNFEGMLDVERFLNLAQELDLLIILRPGPYICAEWEFGGLPAWLLKDPAMKFRSNYAPFLEACERYIREVLNRTKRFLLTRGGNIIMVQYENEYGYFGEDKEYLAKIRRFFTSNGVDVPLFTSDGPWGGASEKGNLEGDLPTFNFGSQSRKQYAAVKAYLGERPFMCMEYWVGWFSYWSGKRTVRNPEEVKEDLRDLLNLGHVNFFMFQGGTNFGFTNGGNDDLDGGLPGQRSLAPTITSYDYDALLTEAGDITEKYRACQEVIREFHAFDESLPDPIERKDFGTFERTHHVSLFEVLEDLGQKHVLDQPVAMEELDQNFGYILYRTQVPGGEVENLDLVGARDRVHYYVNGELEDLRFDTQIATRKRMAFKNPSNQLDLLVENMGRVNFGKNLHDQTKGIRGPMLLDGTIHRGFDVYTLPMDNLHEIDFASANQLTEENSFKGATFSEFIFELEDTADCYLDLEGFTKGFAVVNGFNLGRYWKVGPQKRLYIPGPLLKKGQNTIIVFESDGDTSSTISLCEQPLWSKRK